MEILRYSNNTSPDAKNLFVFLRGLGGSHRSFESEGLVEAVRTRNIDFDMVAPNAHFGFYSRRTLVERIRDDVVLPARQQGYTNIWFVGISMGGLGSLLYLREWPEDIAGIFLIAPFLGYDAIVDEIVSDDGLQSWRPGGYDSNKDWERMFWHWVKGATPIDSKTPIFLGAGEGDKYLKGQKLLSTLLPERRVNEIQGAHDYATFSQLWIDFLESKNFSLMM